MIDGKRCAKVQYENIMSRYHAIAATRWIYTMIDDILRDGHGRDI